MYLPRISTLTTLLFFHLAPAAMAKQPSFQVTTTLQARATPSHHLHDRALIHGLPIYWTGVFQDVVSIQPPLITQAFTSFFSIVAKKAAADPVVARHHQRLIYGALVLDFIAEDYGMVTKEFVEAAALWLLDAAQRGWTGFFKAWVIDRADGERVFIQLSTLWDHFKSP